MNVLQKWFFKWLTAFHVFLYRSTGGRLGSRMGGFDLLLLITTGRKTGQQRINPLGYIRDDQSYVIAASNGGLDRHPGWYFNLKHNPQVAVQVLDRELQVTAKIAKGEERQRLWTQLVEEAPGYADYQTRTTREIPVVTLTPE